MPKIILASSSPRRKELLRQIIGDNFIIETSSYEENNAFKTTPKNLVMHHSREKGRAVAKHFKNGIVISADTVVVFKNKILGKPHTEENAVQMLKRISGSYVNVITGLTVIDIKNGKEITNYEITKVKIKKLRDKEILNYVKSGEPLDKAGAFGIQGKGAIFIEKIDGCYFNVVGLPLFKLNKIFMQIGINIFELKSR
ncbi:MAG: Maf family nucleotide pyrophosphatase [bacterium]